MKKIDSLYGPERKFFEQSLAQYRARVYETSYGALSKQGATMEDVVETRFENQLRLLLETIAINSL